MLRTHFLCTQHTGVSFSANPVRQMLESFYSFLPKNFLMSIGLNRRLFYFTSGSWRIRVDNNRKVPGFAVSGSGRGERIRWRLNAAFCSLRKNTAGQEGTICRVYRGVCQTAVYF